MLQILLNDLSISTSHTETLIRNVTASNLVFQSFLDIEEEAAHQTVSTLLGMTATFKSILQVCTTFFAMGCLFRFAASIILPRLGLSSYSISSSARNCANSSSTSSKTYRTTLTKKHTLPRSTMMLSGSGSSDYGELYSTVSR